MASFCSDIEFELIAKARLKWWNDSGNNPEQLLKEVAIPYDEFRSRKELKKINHEGKKYLQCFITKLGSVKEIFGGECLDYILAVISGHIDYLPRLPIKILNVIISQLSVRDVLNLSLVNKQLHKVSQNNEIWEKIFRHRFDTLMSAEIMNVAQLLGWYRLFIEVYQLSKTNSKLKVKEVLEHLKQKLLSADDSTSDMSGDSV